jgi:hypothetical protein
MTRDEGVVALESAQRTIRRHFLGWQCRLRQHAMREVNGRPSTGMRPELLLDGPGILYEAVTVLLIRRAPRESTAEFRHMARRTRDPRERYEAAVKYFSATYYQTPDDFSDRMTALFGPGSAAQAHIEQAGHCRLRFREKQQRYALPCEVHAVPRNDPFWDATYWHNFLFNPAVREDSTILSFEPDWSRAEAEPPAY